MTIRSKSTMINRVTVALLTAATIGSVIAGSAVPAAAGMSEVQARLARLRAGLGAAQNAGTNAPAHVTNATIVRRGGGAITTKPGGTHANLTSSDCRVLGGTVVTPGDDRCGVGGTYCRFPNTFAMCIDEAKAK